MRTFKRSRNEATKKARERFDLLPGLPLLSEAYGIDLGIQGRGENPDFELAGETGSFGLEHTRLYPDESYGQREALTQDLLHEVSGGMGCYPGRSFSFSTYETGITRRDIQCIPEFAMQVRAIISSYEEAGIKAYSIDNALFRIEASPRKSRALHPSMMETRVVLTSRAPATLFTDRICQTILEKDAKARKSLYAGPFDLWIYDPLRRCWNLDEATLREVRNDVNALDLLRLRHIWLYRPGDHLYWLR